MAAGSLLQRHFKKIIYLVIWICTRQHKRQTYTSLHIQSHEISDKI